MTTVSPLRAEKRAEAGSCTPNIRTNGHCADVVKGVYT